MLYLGDGKGNFTFKVELAGPAGQPGINVIADINGDGIPDIGMLQNDSLLFYLGEGAATYGTPFGLGAGPSAGSILVENLHGQSHKADVPDIVIPDLSGGVMVLLNLTP